MRWRWSRRSVQDDARRRWAQLVDRVAPDDDSSPAAAVALGLCDARARVDGCADARADVDGDDGRRRGRPAHRARDAAAS